MRHWAISISTLQLCDMHWSSQQHQTCFDKRFVFHEHAEFPPVEEMAAEALAMAEAGDTWQIIVTALLQAID